MLAHSPAHRVRPRHVGVGPCRTPADQFSQARQLLEQVMNLKWSMCSSSSRNLGPGSVWTFLKGTQGLPLMETKPNSAVECLLACNFTSVKRNGDPEPNKTRARNRTNAPPPPPPSPPPLPASSDCSAGLGNWSILWHLVKSHDEPFSRQGHMSLSAGQKAARPHLCLTPRTKPQPHQITHQSCRPLVCI